MGVRRRFFVKGFNNGRATLDGPAAHHLGRVLRAEPGTSFGLTHGRAGGVAGARGPVLQGELGGKNVADRELVNLSLGVGPEGGWTEAEFAAAAAAGFREASLGGNILRTETAGVGGLAGGPLS